MTALASTLRARGVALGALLRRDLSAGRRGLTVATARLVVVASSGAIALVALFNADELYGQVELAGLFGWGLLWVLAAFSLLLLPVLALQALRQDRDSGKLELLLLAGLSPRLLAFGRWLATFLLLESLLLDALPALAAFAFFAAPTVDMLAWGALALTGWNALLAGLAVWLSAMIRRAGVSLLVSLSLLLAITGLSIWGMVWAEEHGKLDQMLPAAPFLLLEMTQRQIGISSLPALDALRHLLGAAGLLGVGAAFALLAGERLSAQTRPASAAGKPARKLEDKPRRSGLGAPAALGGWPLTWLLQRSAAASRPFLLALCAPLPMIAVGLAFELRGAPPRSASLGWEDLLDPAVLVTFSIVYWFAALCMGLFATALQVSKARERGEWETLLATGRRGRAIVVDLLLGPSSAVGVLLGLALTVLTTACVVEAAAFRAEPWPLVLSAAAAYLGTGFFVLGLGTMAGLAARTQAGALGLSLLLLVGAATLGIVGAVLIEGTYLGLGIDLGTRVLMVALATAIVVPLLFWLLDRSKRRPGAARLFFELLLSAALITPPLLHGLEDASDGAEAYLMTAIAAAALGIPMLAVSLRRPNLWLGRSG